MFAYLLIYIFIIIIISISIIIIIIIIIISIIISIISIIITSKAPRMCEGLGGGSRSECRILAFVCMHKCPPKPRTLMLFLFFVVPKTSKNNKKHILFPQFFLCFQEKRPKTTVPLWAFCFFGPQNVQKPNLVPAVFPLFSRKTSKNHRALMGFLIFGAQKRPQNTHPSGTRFFCFYSKKARCARNYYYYYYYYYLLL